jgi:hypothetical protein
MNKKRCRRQYDRAVPIALTQEKFCGHDRLVLQSQLDCRVYRSPRDPEGQKQSKRFVTHVEHAWDKR